MKAFIDKLLVIEEMITQRRKLACHLTGKERFQLEGLCALGFMFAPISMWFLIPYCVKRVKRLPVGDEMVPYVTLLMLIGFSLPLWVAVVAILFEVGVFFR